MKSDFAQQKQQKRKIFILSPARTTGPRAKQLFHARSSPLGQRLHQGESFSLGVVFSFLSSAYFRGKMTYASFFAPAEDIFVITPNQGLLPIDTLVSLEELKTFAEVDIDLEQEEYRRPLEIDCVHLAQNAQLMAVFLGSIASPKYVGVLNPILKDCLNVPTAFVGLGDLARGSLLLRKVKEKEELEYVQFNQLKERTRSQEKR